jgi:hypothetical protein
MAYIPFLNNAYFSAKVGIGTDSPDALLKIHQTGSGTNNSIITEDDARKIFIGRDSIKATDLSNNAAMLYLQQNGGNATLGGELHIPSYIYHIGDTNTLFGFGGQDLFLINTGGNRRLTVTNTEATFENNLIVDGSVGIGTTSPIKKLHVKETGGTYEAAIFETNSGGSFIRNIDSTGAVETGIQGGKWSARTSNTQRLVIDSSGNVGIGTTNPGYPLEISSDTSTSLVYQRTGVSANKWGFHSDNDATYWQNITSGNLLFTLQNGGNVGIGTTSPRAKLQVGSRGTAAALTPPATDGILFDFHNDGSPYTRHAAIISQAGDATESVIDFWTKVASGTSAKKMTIRGDGNVGIGTANPSSKLQVAGGVQMADDTDTASADKVGTQRYRVSGNNSYVDMCMQTGAATYAWINIVQNNW